MQLIQLNLCHVLFITIVLLTPERTTAECEEWRLHGSDEVCCKRCRPGNRLVKECGRDRTELCTPCDPNTYTRHPLKPNCDKCTQCTDPQIQVKPCSISTDTVCGCKPGYRCGNVKCEFCVTECTKGQEPTDRRTCRKCPAGTFNDKIHSPCKPLRERCPDGEKIIAQGNEFSDIKCSKIAVTTLPSIKVITTPKTSEKTRPDDGSIYPLIGFFAGIFVLIIIVMLAMWINYKKIQNKSKSKGKEQTPVTPTQGELTIMMVEHEEACSFHQPEQEQGGSSESINTQGSETKLIV